MKTIDKIGMLRNYYTVTRKAGHSTLLKEGIDNYDKDFLILLPNAMSGRELGVNRKKIISWDNPTDLRGHDKPLAIDNSTMWKILNDIIQEFDEQQMKIAELRDNVQELLE